jgi:hypothetical protein
MGWSTSDDDGHYSDNIAKWRMREYTQQSSGVLHQSTAAAVITLPSNPENNIKVTVLVRPFVAFSLNPLRLRQKRNDLIYLDRHTPKGDVIVPGLDFKDPNFPWDEIVKIPTQYSVSIFPHLSRLRLTRPRTT